MVLVTEEAKFNGGIMIMLERWPGLWRESGHVMEVTTVKKGEWSCYRNRHFIRGRKVIRGSPRWSP